MSLERLFVLDTNIIVSAVLVKEGRARQALDKAQAIGVVLLSIAVLSELEAVFARPKFNKYVSAAERKLFLASFVKTARFMQVEEKIAACRDPKDDKYLELAVSSHATCIVSGDADLLILNPFRDVPIVTIQEFLEFESL